MSDFVATRLGAAGDSPIPLAMGCSTLADCRASFDHSVSTTDTDLTGLSRPQARSLQLRLSDRSAA